MGWLAGWSYRKKIKVSGALITGDLVNFPITLNLSTTAGRGDKDLTAIFTELTTNKYKLAVTTEDGVTECYIEIANWENASNLATLFVKAPSLTSGKDAYFYLYYDSTHADNTTYAGTTGNSVAANVWDDDFAAVWHMNTLTYTSYASPESAQNYQVRPMIGFYGVEFSGDSPTTGKVDKSIEITGGTERINIGNSSNLSSYLGTTNDITLEALHNPDNSGAGNYGRIFELDGAISMWCDFAGASNRVAAGLQGITGSSFYPNSPSVFQNAWNYNVFTRVHLTGVHNYYHQGRDVGGEDATGSAGEARTAFTRGDICNRYNAGAFDRAYDGHIDEVRLSRVARSEAWIKATHHTLFDELLTWYEDGEEEAIQGEWLAGYDNRIAFTTDSSLVASALTDFPLTLHLNSSAGINSADLTDFFDKLAYTLTGDDFTGDDGDAPDTDLWENSGTSIQNNGLYGTTPAGVDVYARSKFEFSGDFNIQIDFDLAAAPSTNAWHLQLSAFDPAHDGDPGTADDQVQCSRYYNAGHFYRRIVKIGGSWEAEGAEATSDTTVKLRMARIGDTFQCYWWTGTAWDMISTPDDHPSIGTVVKIGIRWWSGTGNPTMTGTISDFIINSGTVVWPQETHPNRKKIAVTDEDGLTQLPVEIDWFSHSNEVAVLHAKVPVLPSGRNKKIYLYYDSDKENNAMVGDTGDAIAQSVWDDDFGAVYHFSQDPGLLALKDSTVNANDGTGVSFISADHKVGEHGMSWRFGNIGDEYVTIPYDSSFKPTDEYSIEALARFDTLVGDQIIAEYGFGAGGVQIGMRNDDGILEGGINGPGSGKWVQVDSLTVSPHWHYLSMTMSKIGDVFKQFIDEVRTQAVTAVTNSYSNVDTLLSIGRDNRDSSYLVGRIDELRLSSVPRSDVWVKTTNYTLHDTLLYTQAETTTPTFAWLLDDSSVPWKHRMAIRIDHSKIDANLTDFPLTVALAASTGVTELDASHFFEVMDIPGSVDDDFTGTNGDAPNTGLWTLNQLAGTDVATIQSNKLNFAPDGSAVNHAPNYESTFRLTGDFDIQIDFDFTCTPDDTDYSYPASLRVKSAVDDGTLAHLSRIKATTFDGYQSGGEDLGGTTYADSDASGKLRITRISGAVTVYVWTGTQWEWDGSTAGRQVTNANTDDVYVVLYFEQSPNDTLDSNIDNFVVNSGTVSWPVSEYGQGRRVQFTSEDGQTELYAELEYIHLADKKAVYHVKVPIVSSVLDTLLYMYYDSAQDENTTYIGDVYDRGSENVWDSGYRGVYHMGQNPTFNILDSSPHDRDGTSGGSMTIEDVVSFRNGAALDFDGVDDEIDIGSFSGLDNIANMSLEILFNADGWGLGTAGRLLSKINNGKTAGWEWFIAQGTNRMGFITRHNSVIGLWTKDGVISLATDHYAALTYIPGSVANDPIQYIDGVALASTEDITPVGTLDDSAQNLRIGNVHPSDAAERAFDGKVAETRVSSVIRSAAWIKGTYETLFNTLNFFSTHETWLPDYDNRIRVDISGSAVTSALTDFPITVAFTQSAIFTELAYTMTGDDFNGDDGDAPDTDLWVETDVNNYTDIQSNMLNYNTGGAAGAQDVSDILSTFALEGDFDIKISMVITSWNGLTGSYTYPLLFYVVDPDGTEIAYVGKGIRNTTTKQTVGGGTDTGFTSYTDTSGTQTYRITRVSGVIKVYEWDTDNWKWNGSTAGLQVVDANTNNLRVRFKFLTRSGDTVDSDINDFVIHSGTVLWPLNTHPNRQKIQFTNYEGDSLSCELSTFDETNEILVLHARVPDWQVYENKIFYLYYDKDVDDNGNIADSGSAQAADVWRNGYELVMHMNNSVMGGTDAILDSTSNNNHGTAAGTFDAGVVLSDDKLGTKINFYGNNFSIDVPHHDSISFGDEPWTIEVMTYKTTDLAAYELFYSKGYGASAGDKWMMAGFIPGGEIQSWLDDGTTILNPTTAGSYVDDYHYHTFTRDNVANLFSINVDNTETRAFTDAAGDNENTDDLVIGARADKDASYWYQASLLTMRWSKVLRNDSWIGLTNAIMLNEIITQTAEAFTIPTGTLNVSVSGAFKSVSSLWVAFSDVFLAVSESKICYGGTWKALSG